MVKNTDLHTHSIYSDGIKTPEEIVKLASKRGIKNLALTDHNSVNGIKEIIEAGREYGINIIPGVEVVCKEDEVLGYFIDYNSSELKKELLRFSYPMDYKIKKQIELLGFNYNDLVDMFPEANGNYNPAHLRMLLSKKKMLNPEQTQEIYIESKKKVKVNVPFLDILEGINLVKKYKGVPVLAHPWVEPDTSKLLEEEKFKELVNAGLKGIEIDNGDRDERRSDKIIKRIKKLAEKYNLIITSGTDFHGVKHFEETAHDLGGVLCDDLVIKQLKELKWE